MINAMAQGFFTTTNTAALLSIITMSKASITPSPLTSVIQTDREVDIQDLAFCRYANLQNKN
jgi:hypothetical protein